MLRSFITHSDILKVEPALTDYLRSDQSDFSGLVSQAKTFLEQEVKNRGLELKKLCTKLTLTDSTKSDKDHVERTRIVIDATSVSGSPTWVLQGTNDESNETWTTVLDGSDLTLSADGQVTKTFSDTYDYYKLTKTGTATYTAYLVETSWELPHIYLSLHLIYKQLEALEGDAWASKAEMYFERYQYVMNNVKYSYDADEDGTVYEDEMKNNRVMFRR